MSTLTLSTPIDVEALNAACEGVTAPVTIGTNGGELTLMLCGRDAVGCAEVLADLLTMAGIEVMTLV